MYYKFKEIPKEYHNKELWAFDYCTNNTEKGMGLKSHPYKCVIRETNWGRYYCVKLKKNGQPSTSEVNAVSRHYALTEKEAIEGYNELIDEQVMFLMSLAKSHQKDKIEVN